MLMTDIYIESAKQSFILKENRFFTSNILIVKTLFFIISYICMSENFAKDFILSLKQYILPKKRNCKYDNSY